MSIVKPTLLANLAEKLRARAASSSRRRLIVLSAAALMALLALVLVWDIAASASRSRRTETAYQEGSGFVAEIRGAVLENRFAFLRAIADEGHEAQGLAAEPLHRSDRQVESLLRNSSRRLPDGEARAVLQRFVVAWKQHTAVRDSELALAAQQRGDAALKVEVELGAASFEKARSTLEGIGPLLEADLRDAKDAERNRALLDVAGLALLGCVAIAYLLLCLLRARRRLAHLHALEEKNESLRVEAQTEHQHNRVLELISGKEPLDRVLDAVVEALHQQQADQATGCAVVAFRDAVPTAVVRNVSHTLVLALKRYTTRMAAKDPVDVCKNELREAARAEGFEACRFAPVWLRGNEDGGWIVVFHKYETESARVKVQVHRAQRAATLAIENAKLYEQLVQQAHFDALTELPNRLMFHDRLHDAMAHARRYRTKVAILWLDLDGFKRVNDTLGHRAGDTLLRLASQRLQACVRETDTLARLGGDEFTVVLKDVRDLSAAMAAAEEFLKVLRQPFRLANHDLSIGASIGVSVYPDHGEDVTAVVKSADIAMYRAKALGKNRVEAFDSSMADAERDRLELEIELRAAIEGEEFELYYQPQVDAQGRVGGLEALARWNHRTKGVVSPGWFIPMAETSGLIVSLGAWVLRRACQQCREWMDIGLDVPIVAVNVSAVQLAHADFADHVRQCLAESHLAPAHLELEITESSFVSNAIETSQQIERIRELGVRISIDDFGTGYSSLSYLHRLPVDRLKIDRSFVRDINDASAGTASVVRAIVVMAHSLGLFVVAEGAENEQQAKAIQEAGCDFSQGYYFYRPLTAGATAHLLACPSAGIERHELEAFEDGLAETHSELSPSLQGEVSSAGAD